MTGLLVVALVALCALVAAVVVARAAVVEVGRVYLAAADKRLEHAPVVELEKRVRELEAAAAKAGWEKLGRR